MKYLYCKCAVFFFSANALITATLPLCCSHTLPLSLFNHQVLQQMVLGSTTAAEYGDGPTWRENRHHGQHLFVNGPTITHPPTATADKGKGDTASHTHTQKKKEKQRKGQPYEQS